MQIIDGFIGNSAGDDLNNLGHRCKDIEFINFKNYFLVLGDNFSLSFDQPLENTFPFLLSKKLNMSYYNLSVFNGGMDACKNNALIWIKKFAKPRFIICNFTFLNSLLHTDRVKIYNSDFDDLNIQTLYYMGDHNGYFNAKRIMLNNLIRDHFDCPIYQISFQNQTLLFDQCINISIDDTTHENVTNQLLAKIQLQNQKVRP